MSALPPKADMAPTAPAVHQVKATSRHDNELIPPPLNALKLAPPIPNAQACRRALADCTGWDGAITSGAVSSPLVSAAVMIRSIAPPLYAQHGSAPLCAAWLRHDAKMLVTPRAGMQSGEWRPTNPCACVGRRRLHPQRPKKRARPAPLPASHPSGTKRREAIAGGRCNDLPPPSRTAHFLPFDIQSFQFSYPSLPGGYLNGAILFVTKCQGSRQFGVFRPVPFASVSPRSSRNCGVCGPSVSLWSQSNWQT